MATKIIYCIKATFNSGGMERVLANKVNYLVDRGFDITIVTTDQNDQMPFFAFDPRVRQIDLGINYSETNDSGIKEKVSQYLKKQKMHRQKLEALLNECKADIVISMFDLEVSFLYKIKDGSKKVLEIHFSRFKRLQYGRKGLWRLLDLYGNSYDARVARKYDRFVVLTEEDKGYWRKQPNIRVIPNANTFEPEVAADLENKRVIAVGRFTPQKAFNELICAWLKVYYTFPDWTLHIFGDGPSKDFYQAQINELGLQLVVYLCPPTPNIQKEYLESSILAMCSRYEGLPMALLEAQACGLPMVAYACKCGPRDVIISGGNGYLVDEGDMRGLANGLIELIQNEELRKEMGTAARVMSKRFSEDVVMQQWVDLFREVLSN